MNSSHFSWFSRQFRSTSLQYFLLSIQAISCYSHNKSLPGLSWRPGLLGLIVLVTGCSGTFSHYGKVERSLIAGHPEQAIHLIQKAEDDYGGENRLLYLMDYGMVLHLAGKYQESNSVLEEAYHLVEEQYTTRLREQASALLINEAQLPFEGEPFEHVLINVIKALNYACLRNWTEALVEARRIDQRLNILSDRVDGDQYKEDPFARYLTGILYEIGGDLNNAYVAYRKAETVYNDARAWSKVALPDMLKTDLIRMANALHIPEDLNRYQTTYPEVASEADRFSETGMAQVIVVSYLGRSPQKEDLFIDVPISLDALQLVALAKTVGGPGRRSTRGGEALLYGIHGQIARVALPRLVPERTKIAYNTLELTEGTNTFNAHSQRLYDIGAAAEKNLDDGYSTLVLRAVARSAMKMAAAEGIGIGVHSALHKNSQEWVGLLAVILARIAALVTEEADIRSWRTLPGEIQLIRLWVPAGSYRLTVNAVDHQGRVMALPKTEQLDLESGEAHFVVRQYVE